MDGSVTQFTVTREYNGLRVSGRTPRQVKKDIVLTFEHALKMYSHLIARGETVTGIIWARRICENYDPSPRRDRIVRSIRTMLDVTGAWNSGH